MQCFLEVTEQAEVFLRGNLAVCVLCCVGQEQGARRKVRLLVCILESGLWFNFLSRSEIVATHLGLTSGGEGTSVRVRDQRVWCVGDRRVMAAVRVRQRRVWTAGYGSRVRRPGMRDGPAPRVTSCVCLARARVRNRYDLGNNYAGVARVRLTQGRTARPCPEKPFL